MLRNTLLALGAVALASAAFVSVEPEPYAIGDTVDAKIALKDLEGKTWTLGDFRTTEEKEGQVVVIDFWSIGCPVSIRYEERMKKLAAMCKGKDVVFLAIDSNHTEVDADAEDPLARIKAYAKKAEINFPVLIDHGNRVADLFGAKTTPHVYVIDRAGKLQYMGAPDDDSSHKKEMAGEEIQTYAADAITAVLAGETPDPQTSTPQGCTIKRVKAAAQ
jgi:thiol-disulfide isomerase/thioredoxin